MSDPAVAPKRQPRILLIVSLCLNLALIGLIAIAYMRTGMHRFAGHEGHEGKVTLSAQTLMRMVPGEETKIQGIIDAHRKQLHELRQQAMQARVEAFRLLEAQDFKAGDFEKALAAVQGADAALETETMKVTAESVAVLTPAERESVAGKVRKPDRAGLRRFFRGR
jgi:uncharacterized membrane protein